MMSSAESQKVRLSKCGPGVLWGGFPLTDNPVSQELAYWCEMVLPIIPWVTSLTSFRCGRHVALQLLIPAIASGSLGSRTRAQGRRRAV
jgi:hypothetical protein